MSECTYIKMKLWLVEFIPSYTEILTLEQDMINLLLRIALQVRRKGKMLHET